MGTVYKLKIDDQGNMAKVISIIRKFDSSLSMGEIKKRITESNYVVQYDLTHWDITEDMEGIDRIASFENLVSMLQNVGAAVSVYNEDELLTSELFHNKMVTLRGICDEVEKADLDEEVWQYFAVLTDSKATGVKGDQRDFGYLVIVRIVNSVDAMTAYVPQLPWEVVQTISKRITSEISEVTHVALSISDKPPATIEFC